MITGFEGLTYELDKFEEDILTPQIVRTWNKKGFDTGVYISTSEMCEGLTKIYQGRIGYPKIVTPPRLRKVLHHIRVKGLIEGLVATSKGYFKTRKKKIFRKYIDSCWERSNSFKEVAESLERQYIEMNN